MRGLTAEEIFEYAERPGAWADARSSVGRADAALLQLRAATFGPILACLADCPACGQSLEFDAPAPALLALASDERPSYRWSGLGAEVEYRLPTTDDLSAIAGSSDQDRAEAELFERLVLAATLEGRPVPAAGLDPHVVAAVSADMANHDPQAEAVLDLDCPECGHSWSAALDIAGFFGTELTAEARRLMGEVHVLARAYGWSERDILSLSHWRRRAYLELVLD